MQKIKLADPGPEVRRKIKSKKKLSLYLGQIEIK